MEVANNNKKQAVFSKIIAFIEALKAFENNYDKKLNINKLFSLMSVPVNDRKVYIDILLEFQEIFHKILKDYELNIIEKDGCTYLKTKKTHFIKNRLENNISHKKENFTEKMELSKSDLVFWNDFIYSFKNVRRGKGFDLSHNTSEICKTLGFLKQKYPCLFFSNGNGLVYPSKFGVELGSKINSYIKVNHDFKQIFLYGCKISIKK